MLRTAFPGLFAVHTVALLVHLTSFVTFYALVFGKGNEWLVPVSVRYSLWTRPDRSRECDPVANPCTIQDRTEVISELPLGALVGLFSLLSTLNHLEYVLVVVLGDRAKPNSLKARMENRLRDPAKYRNFERWLEYCVSASVMVVVVAALCGLRTLYDFLWVSSSTFAVMWFGYAVETSERKVDKVVFYTAACVTHVLTWIPIVWAFRLATVRSAAPDGIQAIIVAMATLFSCFGLVPFFQFKLYQLAPKANADNKAGEFDAQNKRNLAAEIAYATLSVVAKLLLAWLVYSDVLMRDRRQIEAV